MSKRIWRSLKFGVLAIAGVLALLFVIGVVVELLPGGRDRSAELVAVAFRADGGSPAVSVAYGDADHIELKLPAGEYYIELAYGSDVVDEWGRVKSTGQPIGFGRLWDTTPGKRLTHPDVAAALRTVAGFASDAEAVRLEMLSASSAGFTQPLFSSEPSATDFERFYSDYQSLGGDEADVTAALKLLDARMASSAESPRYVRANAAPPAGPIGELLSSVLPGLFNGARTFAERDRGRVMKIIGQMDAEDKRAAFDQMPENLRGDASNFDEWAQAVQRGDHDQAIGMIHGHLYALAGDAAHRAGATLGQSIAQEGGPLIRSGLDLEVKAYGKVPGVGKAIDLTKKTLEWESYVRKMYADPNAGTAALLKGPYQSFAKDKIKQDLRKAMPANTPDKVIDTLASQLAKGIAATLANGLATPAAGADVRGGRTPGFPPASAPDATDTPGATSTPDGTDWIEVIVDGVAQKLLSEGERGIDVAVVTDDLRQCLRKGVAAGLTRDKDLATCAYILARFGPATPTVPAAAPTPDQPSPCPTIDSSGGAISLNDFVDAATCPTPAPPPAPTVPPPPPTVPPAPPPPAPTKAPCASFDPACGLGAR